MEWRSVQASIKTTTHRMIQMIDQGIQIQLEVGSWCAVYLKKKDNFFCFFFFIFCLHVSVSNVRHQHWRSSFFPFLSLSVCFHCFIFCLIFGLFCLVLSISPSFCGINQSTIVIQRVNRKRRRSWRSWRGGRFEPMSRTMSHSTSRCYQNGNLITSSAINSSIISKN